MILPSWAVPGILKLLRANRAFVTAAGAERRIAERELRPASFAPPSRLTSDVAISVDRQNGWPVYTVSPRETSTDISGDRSSRAVGAAREKPRGSVIYVHGGGWVNEIAGPHWRLIAQIAVEANTAVRVPIYPLIPFGTAREARDVVVELATQAEREYGAVALAGDSAGGQIVLSASLALRDRGMTPVCTTLISPALDLTWSNPRIPEVQPSDPWLAVPGGRVLADAWRGDLALSDPAVSPLYGDYQGLGPIEVYSGVRDVLNPDAHLLVERAVEAGVDIKLHERPGQVHVYPLLPTSIGRNARRDIVSTLHSALRKAPQRGPMPQGPNPHAE